MVDWMVLELLDEVLAGSQAASEWGTGWTGLAGSEALAGWRDRNSGGLKAPQIGHAALASEHWSLNLHLHTLHLHLTYSELYLAPLHCAALRTSLFFFQYLNPQHVHLNCPMSVRLGGTLSSPS